MTYEAMTKRVRGWLTRSRKAPADRGYADLREMRDVAAERDRSMTRARLTLPVAL